MTRKERIDYLDIAKGIGILLVIIGHVEYVALPVRQYITSFHMPLFFLISGMLIRYKQEELGTMKSFICRKCKGIMVPYVIFSMAYLLIEGARVVIKGSTNWPAVLRLVYQSFCLQGISVLWFLPALFMGQVCFVWIRKKSNHVQTLFCMAALFVVVYFVSVESQTFMLAHSDSLMAGLVYDFGSMLLRNLFCVVLVCIGYYCGWFLFEYKLSTVVEMVLSFLALAGVGLVLKWNGGVDLRGMQLGNPLLFLLGGVLGTLGVIFLCRVLVKLSIQPLQAAGKYFGRNSMLIMVTHLDFRVLYVCINLVAVIPGIQENNTIIAVLIILLVCVIEIVLIEFVNRFLPKIAKYIGKNS